MGEDRRQAVTYVGSLIQGGASPDVISQLLSRGGWTRAEVQELIAEHYGQQLGEPPRRVGRSKLHPALEALLYASTSALLIAWLWSMLDVSLHLLKTALGERLPEWQMGVNAFNVANVVVSGILYAIGMRILLRANRAGLSSPGSAPRQWVLSICLFIGIMTLLFHSTVVVASLIGGTWTIASLIHGGVTIGLVLILLRIYSRWMNSDTEVAQP